MISPSQRSIAPWESSSPLTFTSGAAPSRRIRMLDWPSTQRSRPETVISGATDTDALQRKAGGSSEKYCSATNRRQPRASLTRNSPSCSSRTLAGTTAPSTLAQRSQRATGTGSAANASGRGAGDVAAPSSSSISRWMRIVLT